MTGLGPGSGERWRLPASAGRILEEGVLCHLAVSAPYGPHLTPVVYVLDGSSLWLTTSRTSVKARAWRRDSSVAGVVRSGDQAVAFRGRVRTYDALDPLSWPSAAALGPRLVRAATRFTLKNARFFAGYAADARRVPLAWTPPGRVFARVEIEAGAIVRPNGEAEGWGHWAGPGQRKGPRYSRTFGAMPRGRSLDLRAPSVVRQAVGTRGAGLLAVGSNGRLTVIPARWVRAASEGAYYATVPRSLFERAAPGSSRADRGALTLDRASTWRAADMAGLLLQGPFEAFADGETRRGVRALRERLSRIAGDTRDPVLVRLRPERAVWWHGWTSGTLRRGPMRSRSGQSRQNGFRP